MSSLHDPPAELIIEILSYLRDKQDFLNVFFWSAGHSMNVQNRFSTASMSIRRHTKMKFPLGHLYAE